MTRPSAAHAMDWLRSGHLAPEADPRAQADEALDRRARLIRAVFSTRDGELALQTILEASVFRPPVDHRLTGEEYLRFAQLREGQNQLAATLLAYLDHAERLERADHERRSEPSPERPGLDAPGVGPAGLALHTAQPAERPGSDAAHGGDAAGGWDTDPFTALR